MKKTRFTASQIVAIRKYGISSASYYKWKAKYGGLDASERKRINGLEGRLLICPLPIAWLIDW